MILRAAGPNLRDYHYHKKEHTIVPVMPDLVRKKYISRIDM
jgi:hypothetical protein